MNNLSKFILLCFLFVALPIAAPEVRQLNKDFSFSMALGAFEGGDTLVRNYSKIFILECNLTDSTDIAYFDIKDGFLRCKVTNKSTVDIAIKMRQNHLWMKSFCTSRGIDSVNDLPGNADDSARAFLGNLTSATLLVAAHDSMMIATTNLSGSRLFVEQDAIGKKSVSQCILRIEIVPATDPVRITNRDSIIVHLSLLDCIAVDQKGTTWSDQIENVKRMRHTTVARQDRRDYRVGSTVGGLLFLQDTGVRFYSLDGRTITAHKTCRAGSARRISGCVLAQESLD